MALVLSQIKYVPTQDECVHRILGNIYLGSDESRKYIEKLNIDRVIEIGEKEELLSYEPVNIDKLSIVLSDNRRADITDHIDKVCQYIEKNENNVLIHCKMGVSRSVSLLIAYLIVNKNYTYEEGVKLISDIRKNKMYTRPNVGFQKILKKLK